MALHFVKRQREITDALRKTVVEDLPEIEEIQNPELRRGAIEAWAFSLAHSSFGRISDILPEGNPGQSTLKRGTQADHLRGVAHLALAIADEFKATRPECVIDRDVVLTGGLCHDVGKPYEFDPVNLKRWAEDPSAVGQPTLRHTVFGTFVCLSVGLPEEIAHIVCGHSLEGQHLGLSSECMIVRHADHVWWQIAGALGLLKPESLKNIGTMMRPRLLAGELARVAAE
jgi:putative nucleotidyltransferase with HDIG domain